MTARCTSHHIGPWLSSVVVIVEDEDSGGLGTANSPASLGVPRLPNQQTKPLMAFPGPVLKFLSK